MSERFHPRSPLNRALGCLLIAVAACAPQAARTAASSSASALNSQSAIHDLAEAIFAAARSRDAHRFASYFSDRADFVYLINTRQITSRDSLRATFDRMLSQQRRFEPEWRSLHVQVLADQIAVGTGAFHSTAQRQTGGEWEASGVITFVAMMEPGGWRVVNWHTTE